MSRKPKRQQKSQGSALSVLQPYVAHSSKRQQNGQYLPTSGPSTLPSSNSTQPAPTQLPTTQHSSVSLPSGTGLERKIAGKTVWEWLTVLLVPLMIAAFTIAVTLQQNAISQSQHDSDQRIALANRQKDIQIAADQQQGAVLKTYFDDMTDVILNHGLRQSKPGDEVRIVTRTKTLTVLRQLDPLRKAFLVQFLYEAQLITITSPDDDNPIISLQDADLSGITLSSNIGLRRINVYTNPDPNGVNHCNLSHIDLSGADLTRADLRNAVLRSANLEGAYFYQAKLSGTDLSSANLTRADLRGADLFSGTFAKCA